MEEETPMKQEKETVRFLGIKQNNFNYLVLSSVLINLSLFGFFFCYNIHKSLLLVISIISLVINIIFVIYSITDYFIYRKDMKIKLKKENVK